MGIVKSKRSHIRFKCIFPYGFREGKEINYSSVRQFLNSLSSELQRWKGQRHEMMSFGVEITFLYCHSEEDDPDDDCRHEISEHLSEELSVSLNTLLYSVGRIAKNIQLSVCLSVKTQGNPGEPELYFPVTWLDPVRNSLEGLSRDVRYSAIWRAKYRSMEESEEFDSYMLNLIMSSKDLDYGLMDNAWDVDCKACELYSRGYRWREYRPTNLPLQ